MAEGARELKLEPSWAELLGDQFQLPYMVKLREFLLEQKRRRRTVYPAGANIFAALDHTPVPDVRVVVIGQDPYHGPGQAHGLCFSVPPGVPPPPSLVNIFAEIDSDLGREGAPRTSGCLLPWARQGVLLLNAVLTVERSRAGSHQGRGWEQFTDVAVERLAATREHLVFLLWGAYAQRKGAVVDTRRHLVLSAPHPSPLSAHRGFFGCRHFSRANAYLEEHGAAPIDWLAVD